jgi:hypothetical protein
VAITRIDLGVCAGTSTSGLARIDHLPQIVDAIATSAACL